MEKRIRIFVGAYGSGKTEVAINYAFQVRRSEASAPTEGRLVLPVAAQVALADLDLVNPYFRSRELRDAFEQRGIQVLSPPGELAHADLPVIIPQVRGGLDKPDSLLILDVGGDDAGARALSQFAPFIHHQDYEMYLVVNNRRPWTGTPEGVADVIRRIEASSRLTVSALISNPNLGDETTPEVVRSGHFAVMEAARHVGLPVAFAAVAAEVLQAGEMDLGLPVLVLERQLFPPWYEDPLRLAPYHDQRARVLLQGRTG